MEIVNINLKDRSYQILIGHNLAEKIKGLIKDNQEKNFIITDENVANLYGNYLAEIDNSDLLIVEAGEESKSLKIVEKILKEMLEKGATRKSKIIAFGGGMVGDLAGFCSSIYMRGIPFIQIPTTLLAQVDSSVGGKTGINLLDYKNSIGSFYQPEQVIIDIDFLKTLSEREKLSGLGEIVKYGIIYDYQFFKYIAEKIQLIRDCNQQLMIPVIKRCCQIKGEIVEQDEREAGLRKILNFGHTFGHALEGVTGFNRYTHGEAVLIGMYYETLLAQKMGIIDPEYAAEILTLLSKLGLDFDLSHCSAEELKTWMVKDKKNRGGKVSFVLPIKPGKTQEYLLAGEAIHW